MTQEAIELDMDVFAKHIGPYFSWLESKIESGWEQSDHVQKDVLREVRSTSTTMRARFILGVSRTDFVREVERSIGLLELAKEAFPQESDELDAKIQQLTSGIAEKLGNDLLPAKYKKSLPKVEQEVKFEEPKILESEPKTKIIVEKKSEPRAKITIEQEVPKLHKVEKKTLPKKTIEKKKPVLKLETPVLRKPVLKIDKKPVLKLKKINEEKKAKAQKKPSLFSRIVRGMMYRGGI